MKRRAAIARSSPGMAAGLLTLAAACVGAPMLTRPNSEGSVRTLEGAPIAKARVRVVTRDVQRGVEHSRYEAATDAAGQWRAPNDYTFMFVWLLPDSVPSFEQVYALSGAPDVPPVGPVLFPDGTGRSHGQRLQLEVRELPSVGPYLRLLAGISGSNDQIVAAHLGAVWLFEQRWFQSGLRAALQAGFYGPALSLGLRIGGVWTFELSARALRPWDTKREGGVRVGPELGVGFLMLRLSGGVMERLQGDSDVELFLALSWNVIL